MQNSIEKKPINDMPFNYLRSLDDTKIKNVRQTIKRICQNYQENINFLD